MMAQAQLLGWYDDLVETGILRADGHQAEIARKFQESIDALEACPDEKDDSLFTRMFARRQPKRTPVPGLYIYGGVGRGKTMLMDKAFSLLRIDSKKRCHFNDFMLDVHRKLKDIRANSRHGEAVAFLDVVAADIAGKARLLAFDEFQVRDIADAMILSGLFKGLFARGVTVWATSNVAPDDLYEGGLQRERFLPFIDVLKAHVDVEALVSETDYRLMNRAAHGLSDAQLSGDTIFTPSGSISSGRMARLFAYVTGGAETAPRVLQMSGREWVIARATDKACWISFAETCELPRAAEDYLALAAAFEMVFLEGVPKMGYDRRNEAKRFILLIDVLYDKGCRLAMTAEAEPDRLYVGHDHRFEFQRTISRLQEMRRTSLRGGT